MDKSATPINDNQHLPPMHPDIPREKIGVLLVNLGTPDAPTASAVKRYLAEFLSDKRVVDYPRALWLPLLHGVILTVRPAKTAKTYKLVWREESNESPLRYYTREQATKTQIAIGEHITVDWAMRYGNPSVESRLNALKNTGCRRILIIPLYPQYSATTTASVNDAVFSTLMKTKWQPALRTAPAYHDHALYIEALKEATQSTLASLSWKPEKVFISFHGIPKRYFDEGDPYHCHCAKTSRLLRNAMGWTEEFAPMTFQSKFGREEWLGPPTEETIVSEAKKGVKNIAVITPAFVSDCIETLEEIGIAARDAFTDAGGENFAAIECINDSPPTIDLLKAIIETETAGWR